MKKVFTVILIAVLTVSLCACGKPSAPAAETPAPTPLETAAPTPEITAEPTPDASVTVNIYRGDDNAEYVYAESVQIPELSPEALVAALIEAGALNEDAAVNSFTADGGTLTVDLNAAFAAKVSQYGTAGEYIMLGSLVNTFLDAYGAEKLYITVDGAPLETGHNVYDYALEFFERP